MKYKDRTGMLKGEIDSQDKLLEKLYGTLFGRILLKFLVSKTISKAGGCLLDSSISKVFIKPFQEKHNITTEDYVKHEFTSYNDFFTRKKKESALIIDDCLDHLISPCDSKLTVYPIGASSSFWIKQTPYTLESLVRSKKLAKHFQGGTMCVFRLTVDDYHRYCYVDNGQKSKNYKIPGIFHTVNPIANDWYPIYKQNAREFSLLKSEHFGTILMMEVGALLVGKIKNFDEKCEVKRGDEKGMFEFGGSTVILCFQKDRVKIDSDILNNSKHFYETKVRYGEKIGIACK